MKKILFLILVYFLLNITWALAENSNHDNPYINNIQLVIDNFVQKQSLASSDNERIVRELLTIRSKADALKTQKQKTDSYKGSIKFFVEAVFSVIDERVKSLSNRKNSIERVVSNETLKQQNSSTYPWCNSPDVIIGNQAWASCNVGNNTAGTGIISYGNYYQWGDLTYYQWGDINPSKRENIKSGKINDSIHNDWWWIWWQWPCADWYHVPSKYEWETTISTIWDVPIDKATNIQTLLKIPTASCGFLTKEWNIAIGFVGSYYWSSDSDGTSAYSFNDGYMRQIPLRFRRMYNVRCMKELPILLSNETSLVSKPNIGEKSISSIYPWCNAPDIKFGNQIWAACDVWSNNSMKSWKQYWWWNIRVESTIWQKAMGSWWEWPCADWYHVPIVNEWKVALIKAWIPLINGYPILANTLKIPAEGTYWSSSSAENDRISVVRFYADFGGSIIKNGDTVSYDKNSTSMVRCIKN